MTPGFVVSSSSFVPAGSEDPAYNTVGRTFRSGISRRANLRHPVQRTEKVVPHTPLLAQRAPPGGGQFVIPAPPLPGALDPAPFDQAAVLEPIEGGVEGGDVEVDGAVGAAGDQLADLVAVPLPLLEQRQDEQLGAAA